MQVSDAGMLMRATLQASKILIELRGMIPLMRGSDELDVRRWLPRRGALEDLDNELFEEVAHAFVAELLDHDRRHVVIGRAATLKKRGKKKNEESSDDDEEEVVADQYLVRMNRKMYSIEKLVSDHREFLPHLYPLVFGCLKAPEQRPHAQLDYRLALILHTGRDMKTMNAALKYTIDRVDKLRHDRCEFFGHTKETAHTMPCRIVLVLWGASFHPKTGHSYNTMRSNVATLNTVQRDTGGNITLEMYSVVELQADIAMHEDVSSYAVINNPNEVEEIRTIKPHQFAYIRESDPQAKLRDLRVGQIVRVLRTDFDLGGKTYDYRIVVPHDYVLEKVDNSGDEVHDDD